ncbi:MAG: hypothetical protein ABI275_02195 [Terrimesophilobacter sp.]
MTGTTDIHTRIYKSVDNFLKHLFPEATIPSGLSRFEATSTGSPRQNLRVQPGDFGRIKRERECSIVGWRRE